MRRWSVPQLGCLLALVTVTATPSTAGQNPFLLDFNTLGIVSLKRNGDQQDVEFLRKEGCLGVVTVRFRQADSPWQEASTDALVGQQLECQEPSSLFQIEHDLGDALSLRQRFHSHDDALVWTLRLRNGGNDPVEVGDLAVSLPMNTDYPRGFDAVEVKREIFERRLLKHAFISGHASFLFWLPVGGVGPHLVMTLQKGTKLEFFRCPQSNYAHGGEEYEVYIHSAVTGSQEKRGSWRQEHTRHVLPPGDEVVYGFSFDWARDYQGVRDTLFRRGGADIHVAPGMVVPEDLLARFALRTKNEISAVEAEFPRQTEIAYLGKQASSTHIYEVAFSRLGENRLTVIFGDGAEMYLEFLVTQPLETLIKKRARFITQNQQHRDPSRWYDGLFSLWDMRKPEGQNLLGPDNLGGQHPYAVSGSDDPCNSKCIYLSEKNVAYPDANEIAALEYFLRNFVWGRHQRTEAEIPYPYGIYGSDSWKVNRFASRDLLNEAVSRPGGPSQCRMWRTFDYTTYFALYYNMYRIARQHPSLVHYLSAEDYLERAFGTAQAFFEVPYNIRMEGGWSFNGWTDWAFTIGNFHEKYLLGIIGALEQEGRQTQADYLRGQWERKVKYFLYDDPFPFISEMPVDSTAYESTYAIAKYALTRDLQPDEKLWQDKNTGQWYSHPAIDAQTHKTFLKRQLLANVACRGWLETSYYHYGSDFRGCGSSRYTMSYMSQMGGWAILDQALYFAERPAELLQLGYGSMLCSWGLVNAGAKGSNDGRWHPGELHDGAVGWGFFPQKFGDDWNPATKGIPRGPWPVDGEIDHGLTAAVEAAATVVVNDPLFGLIAYGGTLSREKDTISIVPRDGVRRRLHIIDGAVRIHITLDRDGFARNYPVKLDASAGELKFRVENRGSGPHVTHVRIDGLDDGIYDTLHDRRRLDSIEVDSRKKTIIAVPMSDENPCDVQITRRL